METTTKTIWDLLEEAPVEVQGVAELISWSMNFDFAQRPYLLFLDLIGYSEEAFGDCLTNLNDIHLGYMELAKLADALTEYANNPTAVNDFVKAIDDAERVGE